jgi:hypothetical protein
VIYVCVNQALLARQAWRVIQFLESLCARLLRAKYYPHGELIDMVFPGDASPSWHGIEDGMALVKKGIIWRVGASNKIQIWRDSWIPRPPSFKINLKKGRSRIRWVSQLMQPGHREWDLQVLNSCLYPRDVDEVCKIRLSERIEEDMIAWHYEKPGIFTVRSAYQLGLKMEQEEQMQMGSSAMVGGHRPLYKRIWFAPVPPKIRIFAWRLSRESLATQVNREQQTLVERATCTICGTGDEDGHHVVVLCMKAMALRQEMREHWQLPDEAQFRFNGPDRLLLLLDSGTKEEGARILFLFW